MTKEQVKARMAVFYQEGKGKVFCGYGLYTTKFSHYEKTWKAAEAWCAAENEKLSKLASM